MREVKEVVPENVFVKIGISAKNISNEKTLLTGGQFYIVDEKIKNIRQYMENFLLRTYL